MREYIWHSDDEAGDFLTAYFDASKRVLFIGSIGFDPRTFWIFNTLKDNVAASIEPVFIMEERSLVSEALKRASEANESRLKVMLGTEVNVTNIPIFTEDRALIGGRKIVEFALNLPIADYTDIVIDIGAMSRGIFFPLVRCLRERIQLEELDTSLHLLVIDHPELDYSVKPDYEDRASYMHGFDGGVQRIGNGDQMRLWVPQLAADRRAVYDSLFSLVKPSDVCPVLPFPGINAKMVDELAAEYHEQILDSWNTELQNIFLAAESDPLDLYHTVFRLNNSRKALFEGIYSTITVLSPLGTKVSTIGGLLAAMDLDLPVAYVETSGYNSTSPMLEGGKLVHVWVDGPIYNNL